MTHNYLFLYVILLIAFLQQLYWIAQSITPFSELRISRTIFYTFRLPDCLSMVISSTETILAPGNAGPKLFLSHRQRINSLHLPHNTLII